MNVIIRLKKIENAKIQVLMNEFQNYSTYKNSLILNENRTSNNFLSELLLVDISNILFTKMKDKIEKSTANHSNINLRVHEAIVLFEVCNFKNPHRDEFTINSMIYISNLIMQEIFNL